MEKEIWKEVDGYDGVYLCSTLGNVKSVDRFVRSKGNSFRALKGKYLVKKIRKNGYVQVGLCKNNKVRWFNLGRLIYQTFKGKTDLQVDHINEIKTDNKLENLQALSHTDNNIKAKRHNKTSKYPGVYLYQKKKWKAQIGRNGKKISLGYFVNEEDAYRAYLNART
jgi:hypothetical protein